MISLCTLTLLFGASLEDPQVIDAAAVDAFRAGEHELALELWDETLRSAELSSQERSRLLYNAGNAAARGGAWLKAVAYYGEALEGAPRDEALWLNLEFARREAGLEPADRGDLAATCERLLSAWTEAEARWIALGGLLLLAAGLGHEALRGGRAGRASAWLGLGVALLASAPLIRQGLQGDQPELAVIRGGGLAIRSEPRTSAQVLGRVEAGSYLHEVDRLGDWVGVEMSDGGKGWVSAQGIFSLPSAP